MLRDRSELEQNVKEVIDRVKYKRKNIEEINKKLTKNNIPPGFFNEIVKNESILAEIDTGILCLLTIALFEMDGSPSIRTEDYFTEREISESQKHQEEHKSEIELPVTMNNVLQLDHENYITYVLIRDLVKWYHNGLIVYDFESQRSPKYRRGRDGVVPVPDVNPSAVAAIAESMLKETYLPDVMSLNVFSDEQNPVIYNPKTRMFTIKEGSTISILDGFHRLQGAVRAVSINPELTQIIGLNIKIYDTETSRRYFGQINTITPVSSQRLLELKQENVSYVTVKHLQINSDLRGKISSGSRVSEIAGQLTTSEILANAIEDVFEPKNTYEAKEIGQYLADFFNYLLGNYQEEFSSDNLLKHPKMFIGYIVIAKYFRDNNVPLEKIKNVIDHLNITKDNKEMYDLLTNNRGNASRLQRNVREYFEKLNIAVGV